MTSFRLSAFEIIVLCVVALLTALGFLFVGTSVPRFEQYIREDGIVEWLTVGALLAASFVCVYRVLNKPHNSSGLFILTNVLLALLLFIAAGEEISWGQRLFGIETPEYFREKNLQSETNFHNLKINGVEINRLVFSYLLISALVIYLGIFPFLYKRKLWMRRFADRWGIPIAQGYQVAAFAAVFAITALIPHGKRAEILECGGALLFYLITRYPANVAVLRRDGNPS